MTVPNLKNYPQELNAPQHNMLAKSDNVKILPTPTPDPSNKQSNSIEASL